MMTEEELRLELSLTRSQLRQATVRWEKSNLYLCALLKKFGGTIRINPSDVIATGYFPEFVVTRDLENGDVTLKCVPPSV